MTAIAELLAKAGRIPEGKCLAGFSGGADSTALIRMLALARDAGMAEPEAVHVNHRLRGAESDRDEAFCRQVCEELNIPFHTASAQLDGRKDENSCRKERFRCFREVMEETGIRILVLAHNRDDLAETFLMRLLRGAGTEGLACMSETDEHDGYTVFRPLLKTGREEIREALRQDGLDWREDSTNNSDAYLRNRIRGKLIPLMEDMAEGVTGRIAQTADILTRENRMNQDVAELFLRKYGNGRRISAEALMKTPEALQRRILRTWWRQNMPEAEEHALNVRQTEELASLVKAGKGKVNLPGGITAVTGRQGIYLTGFPKEAIPEILFDPENRSTMTAGTVKLTVSAPEGNPGDGKTEQEVPKDFLQGCVLRTRKDGDRIRPFGMSGSRKLQDYLTDRKIDEPMRDRIPLLCRGKEVLLAAGVGAGAVPRWDAGAENIRLKWQGDMPWMMTEGERTGNGPEQ